MFVKSLATAAALALSPMFAGAVTIGGSFSQPGDNDLFVGAIGSGNAIPSVGDGFTSVAWMFTAQEDLAVSGAGAVNGFSAFTLPIGVSYSADGVTPGAIVPFGAPVNDTQPYLLPSLVLAPGDVFYVLIEYAGVIDTDTDAEIDFRLVATSVPLPGAGLMFIVALAGMVFLARRRASA